MDDLWNAAAAGEPLSELGIFDCHTHLGPWSGFHIPGDAGAAGLVRVMDRLGIATIVCAPHLGIGPDDRAGNDLLRRAMDEHPGRILGYCAVNPNRSEPHKLAELQRCADDARFVGVKIHPSLHRHPLEGPGYQVVWEFATERGWPLLTHTWGGDPHCSPSMLAGPARRYPRVTILVGHCGANLQGIEESIAAAREHANVYLDITASYMPYGILERMVAEVGADRVLFGTDMPFLDPRPKITQVAGARIPVEDKRKIFAENARRVFGLGGRSQIAPDC